MKAKAASDARHARLRFGNPAVVREDVRRRRHRRLARLGGARRALRAGDNSAAAGSSPSAVVASLVIGIGANTAIFTLVDAALLKDIPVEDPRSLILIEWTNQGGQRPCATRTPATPTAIPPSLMQGSSISPLALSPAGLRADGRRLADWFLRQQRRHDLRARPCRRTGRPSVRQRQLLPEPRRGAPARPGLLAG